jgi:septal ring factor EnvC (AmiA/AmiB activator)
MNVSNEFLFGVAIMALALTLALYTMLRHPDRMVSREEQLENLVKQLEATVNALLARSTADQQRITSLEREIEAARHRITDLERELAFAKRAGKAQPAAPTQQVPASLRKLLTERLAEEDLRQVAFDLSADYDTWAGDTLPAKVTSMLAWYARRGQLDTLLTAIATARPDIPLETT